MHVHPKLPYRPLVGVLCRRLGFARYLPLGHVSPATGPSIELVAVAHRMCGVRRHPVRIQFDRNERITPRS